MKKRKLEAIWVTTFLILGICNGFAQVTLSPDPTALAQCPQIPTTFTLSSNFNPDCHTVTADDNCSLTLTTPTSGGPSTISVTFFDNGMRAKISITKISGTDCSSAANGKVYYKIPIKTLVGLSPNITGPSTSSVGFVNEHDYTASLNYPFRGTNDPATLPVTNFNWELPSGWVNTTIPSTSSTIHVVTDLSTSGGVTATPIHACVNGLVIGSTKYVQRTLSSPCPVSADLFETYCGQPATNALSATAQPVGYTPSQTGLKYAWTLPTGWSFDGSSTSRNVDVNMDGQHGGTVTVVAKDYGINSPTCTFDIPLRLINSTRAFL